MSKDTSQSEFFKLELKDGILFVTYIGGPITLEVAKDLIARRIELANNKAYPVLVNSINVDGFDREARSFLSSEKGLEGLVAGAIVVNSAFTKHLANFFMKISFNKSKMPAKVFSEEKEALVWLEQFIS